MASIGREIYTGSEILSKARRSEHITDTTLARLESTITRGREIGIVQWHLVTNTQHALATMRNAVKQLLIRIINNTYNRHVSGVDTIEFDLPEPVVFIYGASVLIVSSVRFGRIPDQFTNIYGFIDGEHGQNGILDLSMRIAVDNNGQQTYGITHVRIDDTILHPV